MNKIKITKFTNGEKIDSKTYFATDEQSEKALALFGELQTKKESIKDRLGVKLTVKFTQDVTGYIAQIKEMPGMIATGETTQDAWEQLMVSLQVKIAQDSDYQLTKISA